LCLKGKAAAFLLGDYGWSGNMRELIIAALRKEGGNQVRAAQLLGISRVMLHDRIEKFGIKTEVIVQKL
jgi:transcriptional regulator with GAF, ATPase, and Fis domain